MQQMKRYKRDLYYYFCSFNYKSTQLMNVLNITFSAILTRTYMTGSNFVTQMWGSLNSSLCIHY